MNADEAVDTSDILGLIDNARRPERSVPLCLRGDLVAAFEDLERQFSATQDDDKDSFAGSGKARQIAAQMEELREQMKAAEVIFRLRSIGSRRFAKLVAQSPPRKDNAADARLGFHPEALYTAIIRECCYAIERDGKRLQLRDEETNADLGTMPDEKWVRLFGDDETAGTLSHQQFDRLATAAWNLDHDDVSVPTLPLAWLISQRSDESSKQHGAGEPEVQTIGGDESDAPSRPTSTKTPRKGKAG